MELKELGKTGMKIAAVGMGTWMMGDKRAHGFEADALRRGLELGMTFVDTAEAYGSGDSEKLVGEAIRDYQSDVFIATKVSAGNLSYNNMIKACDASLKRLNIRCIDLYQIHWSNPSISIKESMRAMEHLVDSGKIRFIGVSNFSVSETRATQEALSKHELASNQVHYSLATRQVESDLIPYCESSGVTIIAYSPLDSGNIPALTGKKAFSLEEIAVKYGKTKAQVALNWLITRPTVTAIPKAARIDHVEENAGAADWRLGRDDYDRIDNLFRKQ